MYTHTHWFCFYGEPCDVMLLHLPLWQDVPGRLRSGQWNALRRLQEMVAFALWPVISPLLFLLFGRQMSWLKGHYGLQYSNKVEIQSSLGSVEPSNLSQCLEFLVLGESGS